MPQLPGKLITTLSPASSPHLSQLNWGGGHLRDLLACLSDALPAAHLHIPTCTVSQTMTQASRMPSEYRTIGPLLIVMASGWGGQGSSMLSAQILIVPQTHTHLFPSSLGRGPTVQAEGGKRKNVRGALSLPGWAALFAHCPLLSDGRTSPSPQLRVQWHLFKEALLRCHWVCLLLSVSPGKGSLHKLPNV